MSFVVVEDVAASWEHYRRFADALAEPAPAGLILHAAGPTDEGYRIVGVWESEQAWARFAERLGPAERWQSPPQTIRMLRPEHVVYGTNRSHEPRLDPRAHRARAPGPRVGEERSRK